MNPLLGKPEDTFQTRLIKILRGKGYLVLNASRKQIFDIVAIKNQVAYPIEVKAKATNYKDEQFNRQIEIAEKAKTSFFIIRQHKKHGKMNLSRSPRICTPDQWRMFEQFKADLEKYLV